MSRRLSEPYANNKLNLKTDENLGAYQDWNGVKVYQSQVPSKVYKAVLSQASTDAPTASVKHNGLSAAIAWTRSGAGVYVGTLTGAFPTAAKVFFPTCQARGGSTGFLAKITRTDENVVTISVFDAAGAAADLVGDLDLVIEILQ